jgi:hypothetical protein
MPTGSPQIWAHPGRAGWSAANRALVAHAERFSALMQGAALLYNLMLSERIAAADRVEGYRARLAVWAEEMAATPTEGWDLGALWAACLDAGYRVTPQTMRFVAEWRTLAGPAIADDAAARAAVERREMRLKGAKSRFRNAAALARWGGDSGTGRLGFRWPVAVRHLQDLADAA